MSGLAFAAPWALAALAVLPVLWLLLRVTPPPPRLVRFPPVRLLFGLEAREDAAARTPWWVLALRLLLAVTAILAVAGPLVNPAAPLVDGSGPLVIAVDDGWAAARDWPARSAWLSAQADRAERAGKPVIVVATAPPAEGGPLAVAGPMAAGEARRLLAALQPKPWPTDRAAAAAAVQAIPRDTVMAATWLADGLDDGAGIAFARALQSLGGGLEVVAARTGRILIPPEEQGGDPLTATVRRPGAADRLERVAVRAMDGRGTVLARTEADLPAGEREVAVSLRLPGGLHNRLARLDIEDEAGAAAVVLADERWRRRPVGLAAGGAGASAAPLLDPLYYLRRALAPVAELSEGELSALLGERPPTVLMLADVPAILGTTARAMTAWMEGGGVLVRFAGPAVAQAQSGGGEPDAFLPVPLRAGGRSLGGALSWTVPQGLAPFPEDGPFAGLAVPADVQVRTQVLAEPTAELAAHTWARLADGTPLVTAARRGKGWAVLVHTTANAEWSNLALSGLFPELLQRLTRMAEGRPEKSAGPLPPAALLDGFGRLTPPGGAATALATADTVPGPRHPPGLYGESGVRVALHLGPALGWPAPLALPTGVKAATIDGGGHEIDLRPGLQTAALLLALLDLAAALALRGVLRARTVAVAVAVAVAATPAAAAEAESFALDAALSTRLAAVRTGNAAVDRKSLAGLSGLSRAIDQRSTLHLAEPMAVDVERDPVLFFPLLYWPVTATQPAPSAAAVERLNTYLRKGGLIVFDRAAEGPPLNDGGDGRLEALTRGLALPALAPLPADHVLTRSFYLLAGQPGRFDGGTVWVEAAQGGAANDGVTPVVVGAADWAGAWAADAAGRPLYPAVPGGERQRESALRFGVNLVMVALTGNYKADQVHLPAIMERLRR
ncbi:MAG: DUF4159 domain-containing protein [Magnetospirillum sp.]|nr:DUF4159 domain-containing protein [Magnetospirillum sp.]